MRAKGFGASFDAWDNGNSDGGKGCFDSDSIHGPATEEQLLSHLSAALEKKGYVKGVKVKSLFREDVNILNGEFYLGCTNDDIWGRTNDDYGLKLFNMETLEFAQIIEQPKEVEKPKYVSRFFADTYQNLFNLLSKEHGITPTITEMDEIIREAQKVTQLQQEFENSEPKLFIQAVNFGATSITLSNGKTISAEQLNQWTTT